MKLKSHKTVLFSLVILAIFSRFIPHPANMTAVTALALFSGQKFESKLTAILLPLVALFLSDLVIGFHSSMVFVYGAFLIISLLSIYVFEMKKITGFVVSALSASSVFFVITNLGVWFTSGMYAKNISGLMQCFVAAIPFFENQLIGDMFYSAALFGAHALLVFVVPVNNRN